MGNTIAYSLIQLLAGLFAVICIGHGISKEATKLDKVLGFIFCVIFMCFILYVQGVLKC